MKDLPLKLKQILVVRNDRFGEFILNIPALRALKESFPGCRLSCVVDPATSELAGCVPYIDRVISWKSGKRHSFLEKVSLIHWIRKNRFDAAVMLNPSKEFNFFSWAGGVPYRAGYDHKAAYLLTHKIKDDKYLGLKHEVEYNLDLVALLGAGTQDKSLTLKVESGIIDKLLDNYAVPKCGRLIAVHPWASDKRKLWPQESFLALCRLLAQKSGFTTLIIGSLDNQTQSAGVFGGLGSGVRDLTGKTSLKELAALLKKSALLISADSGPMHLACAVGTPVVALFRNDLPGKTSGRWGPWPKERSRVIERDDLARITPDEVMAAVEEMLKR